MKSLLCFILLPLLLAGNNGMDLGVERMYVGFQAVPNSKNVCKLVLNTKVTNHGDIESPVCDLQFFASPVRDDENFPSRISFEVASMAPGESLDFNREWRVDKEQADQLCEEMCCGMMLIKAKIVQRDTIPDVNSRNDEIVSVLLGKKPETFSEITSLDSVFVKMKEDDRAEIIKELDVYSSMILRMVKAGNSGCWINQENGYASIVHLNK